MTDEQKPDVKCPICNGSGQIADAPKGSCDGPYYSTCAQCRGSGKISYNDWEKFFSKKK